ncbi:MAG: hypothetical protein HKP61_01605 [Dactylosporangium sp.]|nr:hypothetical protein [Dactylosporangium sp.]NNJ59660.1 hypothetical protein [Dactylosporangium sp.]
MRAIRAELIKIGTLPAVRLTIMLTWTATVVLALVYSAAVRRGEPLAPDQVLAPIRFVQAGFVVLGVLVSTSEYQGGQIRTTLAALPRRLGLLAAKTLALAVTAVPVAAVAGIASAVVAREPWPESVEAVAASTGYLTLTTLLAAAVATAIRHPVPAVATLLGYYFIAGPLLRDRTGCDAYLPDTAALGPAPGLAATSAWALAALGATAIGFQRRDA